MHTLRIVSAFDIGSASGIVIASKGTRQASRAPNKEEGRLLRAALSHYCFRLIRYLELVNLQATLAMSSGVFPIFPMSSVFRRGRLALPGTG